MNLSTYRFIKDNTGIFVYGSLLFPQDSWVWDYNGVSRIDFKDYQMNAQIGILAGVAFKINFTDDFKFYSGIGLNYFSTSANYPGTGNISYSIDSNDFGIGCDIGLKFDATDRFFLKFGSVLTFNFVRYTTFETYTGRSTTNSTLSAFGWDQKFFMFNARPYISAGINLFWQADNDRLKLTTGKPR